MNPTIPDPAKLHPVTAELTKKLFELQIQRNEKVAETTSIRARLKNDMGNTGNAADNRVRAILGQPQLPEATPDKARLDQLLTELSDLNKAISLLDGKIRLEKATASRLVLDAVGADVARLGTAFAKAFLDLHSSHLAFNRFVDALEDVGVSVTAMRVCPNGVGYPTDLSGSYMYGVRDFIDAGFLLKSDMPKVLQP